MDYYIAIFWSRSESFSFASLLKRNNIPSAMIPTPKEAGRTCGLSVKILPEYYNYAKTLLTAARFQSFGGWLYAVQKNGRVSIIRN